MPKKRHHMYLLAGKLFYGECGGRMRGEPREKVLKRGGPQRRRDLVGLLVERVTARMARSTKSAGTAMRCLCTRHFRPMVR
jgi:hypothetical protein